MPKLKRKSVKKAPVSSKKKAHKQKKNRDNQVATLLATPEVWIGIVIVVSCVLLLVYSLLRIEQKKQTVESNPATPTVTAPISSAPTQAANEKETTIVVQPNDNFWKISNRICGTGVYYLSIQAANGYDTGLRSLHEGDSIKVKCSY